MADADRELIIRFRQGDQSAFTTLVERWEKPTLELAFRLTGNLQDAQDVRQGAFINAFRGLSRFNRTAVFGTWLYRIVINESRDLLGSRKSRLKLVKEAADRAANSRCRRRTPDQINERLELRDSVAQAIVSLSPDKREVLVLRHYHGLKLAEIATVLDEPVSTIKTRAAKALQLMRDKLSPLVE